MVWELAPVEALIAAYQLQDGTGYNALEEGWLVWELARGGALSLAEVGRRLKRSKAWVSGRLGLIEGLPEPVLEGVLSGKIGAYVATRYLLPFARANASDCEKLAQKIIEQEFRSREVEALCQHYAAAPPSSRRRIVEEPARFLAALKQARKGAMDPKLSEAENRCVKNLELIRGRPEAEARELRFLQTQIRSNPASRKPKKHRPGFARYAGRPKVASRSKFQNCFCVCCSRW